MRLAPIAPMIERKDLDYRWSVLVASIYPAPAARERAFLRAIQRIPGWLYLIIASFVVLGYYAALTPQTDDFDVYYNAAQSLRTTGNPYIGSPEYIYPPLLAWLTLPLTLFPLDVAQHCWFGINVVLLAVLIWACLRTCGNATIRPYWGPITLAVVLAPGTGICLRFGQVGILLALLSVGVFALERRPALAGLVLALASLIKLYPGVLGFALLRRRSFAALVWAVIAAIAVTILSFVPHGFTPYARYLANPLPRQAFFAAAEFNTSIYGLLTRLFSVSQFTVPVANLPWLAQLLALVAAVPVVVACFAVTRPSGTGGQVSGVRGRAAFRHSTSLAMQAQSSLWLCAALLLAPLNGCYNLMLLLFPLLTVLRYVDETGERWPLRPLAISLVLLWFPPLWADGLRTLPWLYRALHTGWGALLLVPPLYGVLVLFVVLVRVAHRCTAGDDTSIR